MTITLSWLKYSPSSEPTISTCWLKSEAGLTVPSGAVRSPRMDTYVRAALTCRIPAIRRSIRRLYAPASTCMSDGLLAARIRGYADWVRRAAATLPIATPPSSPVISTIARYPARPRRSTPRSR